MEKPLEIGDKALIQLNNGEIYEGKIVNMTNNYIELEDIYLRKTHSTIFGFLKFFRKEIANVRCIIRKENGNGGNSSESSSTSINDKKAKAIKIKQSDFEQLQEMTRNPIFIDVRDKNYHDALDVLNNCESIGVVGVGSTFTRKAFSLLFMSDFKQIYIFDMMSGNINTNDLKAILESEYITKVVHDVRPLFDCLFHKYQIKLANVFDTQVADSKLYKEETGESTMRNLSQCMEYHLHFPHLILDAAMEDYLRDENWVQRPIIKSQQVKGAQLVVYLLTLRDYLLKQMLRDFHEEIGKKCKYYEKLSDFELFQQMNELKLK